MTASRLQHPFIKYVPMQSIVVYYDVKSLFKVTDDDICSHVCVNGTDLCILILVKLSICLLHSGT